MGPSPQGLKPGISAASLISFASDYSHAFSVPTRTFHKHTPRSLLPQGLCPCCALSQWPCGSSPLSQVSLLKCHLSKEDFSELVSETIQQGLIPSFCLGQRHMSPPILSLRFISLHSPYYHRRYFSHFFIDYLASHTQIKAP